MKTKELIKYVGRFDSLYIKDQGNSIAFYEVGSDSPYFIISKSAHTLSEGRTELRNIKKSNLAVLLDIGDHIVGYLNTPLAEREEEKRYFLRKVPITLLGEGDEDLYLMIDLSGWTNGVSYVKKGNTKYFQTVFTESELSKMDITGFEKIEVD